MIETRVFICFWLNYSNKNNLIGRIPFAVKNIDYLFVWLGNYFNLSLFAFRPYSNQKT